jgi:hypothetical protein
MFKEVPIITVNLFTKDVHYLDHIRKQLGVLQQLLIILFVGSITPVKLLNSKLLNVCCTIIPTNQMAVTIMCAGLAIHV